MRCHRVSRRVQRTVREHGGMVWDDDRWCSAMGVRRAVQRLRLQHQEAPARAVEMDRHHKVAQRLRSLSAAPAMGREVRRSIRPRSLQFG
eukprot:2449408-Pleurochrysis_carterae.AAC.1